MTNYDSCLVQIIEDTVADTLKRLPGLKAEDRYSLLMEQLEWIAVPLEVDDEMMVPNLKSGVEE